MHVLTLENLPRVSGGAGPVVVNGREITNPIRLVQPPTVVPPARTPPPSDDSPPPRRGCGPSGGRRSGFRRRG